MFLQIWMTNFCATALAVLLVTLENHYPQSIDGALFVSVLLGGCAYAVLLNGEDKNFLPHAHSVRSVALSALFLYIWNVLEFDAFSFMVLLIFGAWSFQQGYEAAVQAQKVVGHNKLSFPYGFAAWGVIGIVLGPLILAIVWMSHGHTKLQADVSRIAKA